MYVGVTLHYGDNQQRDLDLPCGIPVGELTLKLGALIQKESFPGPDDHSRSVMTKYVLKHREQDRVLDSALPLSQSGAADGDHLLLLQKAISKGYLSEEAYRRVSGPALVNRMGTVLSLGGSAVVIGRNGIDRVSKVIRVVEPAGGNEELMRTVSRQHALITRWRQEVLIQDLDSRSGSFLNGTEMVPFQQLNLFHGDRITLGSCRLIFIWDWQETVRENVEKRG